MFRVENNVPEVYPSESRDFQLFSRLYDLVFQASRYSIDSMLNISNTEYCNDSLLPLLGTKVGFFSSSKVTDKTLRRLLSAFPDIIKYKGSRRSIDMIISVFEKLANTSILIRSEPLQDADLTLEFLTYNADLELLQEVLEYVRPTGYMINYITSSNIDTKFDIISTDRVNTILMKPYKSSVSQSATIDYSNTVGHTQIVTLKEPQE